MDPIFLLKAAMAVLSPLISKGGEKAAETIGQKLANQAFEKPFWKQVKSLFIVENEAVNEPQIIKDIENKPVATSNEVAMIETKLAKAITSNPEFAAEMKVNLNITPANQFIVEQTINSIIKAQKELADLWSDHDALDKIDRPRYAIRIKTREEDLLAYENKLITTLKSV